MKAPDPTGIPHGGHRAVTSETMENSELLIFVASPLCDYLRLGYLCLILRHLFLYFVISSKNSVFVPCSLLCSAVHVAITSEQVTFEPLSYQIINFTPRR